MNNLSVDLRPERIDEVIGNTHVVESIKSQLGADVVSRAYMFSGPPGLGKTTLGLILARLVQGSDFPENGQIDLVEVNAADNNSVEFVRNLVSETAYRPFSGKYKVVLLNEAQQLTKQAQEVLQPPLEAKDSSTIWILTTKEPAKIDQAIQDRCKHFKLKPLSTDVEFHTLVERAAQRLGVPYPSPEIDGFVEFVIQARIGAPRVVLQAFEKFVTGIPLKDCFTSDVHEPMYRDVAASVVRGEWNKCRALLAQIPTADSRALRSIVSGFLRSALLKEPSGPKADAISACLMGLGTAFEDGIAWSVTTAAFYRCCKAISAGGK